MFANIRRLSVVGLTTAIGVWTAVASTSQAMQVAEPEVAPPTLISPHGSRDKASQDDAPRELPPVEALPINPAPAERVTTDSSAVVPTTHEAVKTQATAADAQAAPQALPSRGPQYPLANVTNYEFNRAAQAMIERHGEMHGTLVVRSPVSRKVYVVQVSAPRNCTTGPRASCRRMAGGRGIVDCRWPCGWRIKIFFSADDQAVVQYSTR